METGFRSLNSLLMEDSWLLSLGIIFITKTSALKKSPKSLLMARKIKSSTDWQTGCMRRNSGMQTCTNGQKTAKVWFS